MGPESEWRTWHSEPDPEDLTILGETAEQARARYDAARQRGRIADETEPRAVSARYDRTSRRVIVELRNGCTFMFPADMGQGLRGASDEDLAEVEIMGNGFGLHWEKLDADLAVPSLMAGRFGSKAWMSELGRMGGKSKSAAKAAAARANGKKGGRPKKAQ
jgi:hypothetical protein